MINKKLLTYLISENVLDKYVKNTDTDLIDNDIFEDCITSNFVFSYSQEGSKFWRDQTANYFSLEKPVPLSDEEQELYDFIEFLYDNDALGKYFKNRFRLRPESPLFTALYVPALFIWDKTDEGRDFWEDLGFLHSKRKDKRKPFPKTVDELTDDSAFYGIEMFGDRHLIPRHGYAKGVPVDAKGTLCPREELEQFLQSPDDHLPYTLKKFSTTTKLYRWMAGDE